MNIFVIGHSVNHYRQRKMWEWIAEQGHKVSCLTLPRYADEINEPMKKGSFEMLISPPYGGTHWHFPELIDIVGEKNPDIIMCYQEPFNYVTLNALNVAKLYHKPFVFFSWENIRKAYPQPQREIESQVVKGSDLAIAGNLDCARILMEKGARVVENVLQTGLDPNLFCPVPRLNIDGRKEPKKLLYVGRLVPEKGIEVILKAFDKLDKNYVLKFVGGRGPLEEMIKEHSEFGKRIEYVPWVDHTKLTEIYNWADVLLLPSIDTPQWIEQCGYVIGESLLCETPVITTASKSITEIWKLPGVSFIPQGDIDLLVDTLMTKEIYKKTPEGRKEVIKKYSYEAIGSLYLKILGDLV